MIDALPTILDLAGLAVSEVLQGQSLAPLLRGEPGWEPRPVIVDESGSIDVSKYDTAFEIDDDTWKLHRDIWTTSQPAASPRPVEAGTQLTADHRAMEKPGRSRKVSVYKGPDPAAKTDGPSGWVS
ncbi:MAG: hypothetical protein E2P06_15485 [Acidobacteria bacterium]|nr:MAG: hypothetical protein E2P06_15485 [Acidobacteriota bacterium]